ncbi:MAG: type VI secretion system contractile sheath large subunit, partial [Bryobacteraceae bacterium]|nr:type VI secretion system contractile sheath large subunit [Bryobacteraceae bacterium]
MPIKHTTITSLAFFLYATLRMSAPAQAEDDSVAELPPVTVTASKSGTLTVPSTAQAIRAIQQTPGGVAVVPAAQFKNSPANTYKDILGWVPGVVTQNRWGPDGRLSIRGSGLSRNYGNRGINMFMDGVPINTADGLFDLFEIDPSAYQYVEVYKGANALRYGGNSLGGAINFVTPTGREAAGLEGRGKDLVKRFVSEVLEGSITINRDTETMINARIAQIDHLLSLQINEIMHHKEFQKLEGSWRGLQYLLKQSETSSMLKIKVMNVSKKDLLRDLQRAPEFDQSALFKKVYEEEYGVFGGTPFGALVGDYYFDRTGQDIELLEKISNVAAAAHAPFLTAASHEMLNLDSFSDLDSPRDLGKIFDSTEFAKWKAFRNTDDSRYVALTAPRVLMREP